MPKIKAGKRLYHGDKVVLERIRERFDNPFARLGYPTDLSPEEAAAFQELYPEDCPRPEPTAAEKAREDDEILGALAIGGAIGTIGPSRHPEVRQEVENWAREHPAEIAEAVESYRNRNASAGETGNVIRMTKPRKHTPDGSEE